MANLPFATTLTVFGILTAITITLFLIDFALPFLRPSKIVRYLHSTASKQPAWALVTGASDGIGRALSHELASRGFNVVLHGRNPPKLERVQRDLQAAFPRRDFRSLVADATHCITAPDMFRDIVARVSDLHLTVLINNAGGTPPGTAFKALDSYSHKDITDTISLNATFPTMLINALLPVLGGRNGGPALVVTVGSLSDGGMPLVAAYGASKAYLMMFAKGLAMETHIAGRNELTVQHMRIGTVTGVSHSDKPPTTFEPDASTVARAILARVGCGRTSVVPYWGHALQSLFADYAPRWVKDRVLEDTMAKLRDENLKGE
ncbi:short chain dehydrogenase/reductase [Apodospora peruviana]|uniref:Short chain dehydrogenase/reductase n=1 Tax=Apodospora peruviana TaxID=516989 RepID=A0AAE0HW96_9PEZI|nr:short chain dehydrogenase/reductase [Apodospora peruviana]